MKSIARSLLALGPLAILAGWGLLAMESASLRRYHEALIHLASGDIPAAGDQFRSLSYYPWVSTRARAGLQLCSVLQGETLPEPGSPALSELQPLARSLFFRAFFFHDYETARSLTSLFRGVTGDEDWDLYLAAILLEQGEDREAFRRLSGLNPTRSSWWLWNKLKRIEREPELAKTRFVYDRRGRLLGYSGGSGDFTAEIKLTPGVLPIDVISQLDLGVAGGSIRLTLDLELSKLAAAALRGYRGSIALVDPETGDILAAVSDSWTYRREGSAAFHQFREPASISKLITAAAAVRAGLDPDAEIARMRCTGAHRYDGDFLYCPYTAGRLSGLNHAMALSCNLAFANLGVKVGHSTLNDELRFFGFDSPGVEGIEFGRIEQPWGNARHLADLSIGLENTSITPVHGALVAATFANEGIRPRGRLIFGRNGLLGLSPLRLPEIKGRTVLSRPALLTVRDSMVAVAAPGGTGFGLTPKDFPIAMKTGTASEPGVGYHTNYVGYGPLERPTVAFCFRVTHQRTSSQVRSATGTVARRFLRSFAARYGSSRHSVVPLQADGPLYQMLSLSAPQGEQKLSHY